MLGKRTFLTLYGPTDYGFTADCFSLFPTMENPVDRTIRLMAVATGAVSLLVYVVFHLV